MNQEAVKQKRLVLKYINNAEQEIQLEASKTEWISNYIYKKFGNY